MDYINSYILEIWPRLDDAFNNAISSSVCYCLSLLPFLPFSWLQQVINCNCKKFNSYILLWIIPTVTSYSLEIWPRLDDAFNNAISSRVCYCLSFLLFSWLQQGTHYNCKKFNSYILQWIIPTVTVLKFDQGLMMPLIMQEARVCVTLCYFYPSCHLADYKKEFIAIVKSLTVTSFDELYQQLWVTVLKFDQGLMMPLIMQ